MRVAELRRELQLRGLDTSGTKEQLVPRLLDVVPFKQHRAAHHPKSRRRRPANHGAPSGIFASVVAWLDEPPDSAAQRLSSSAAAGSSSSPDQSDPRINPERTYILQVKGSASLQSGGAGVGIVLFDPSDESLSWEARKYLPGSRGLFEAEYSAMIVALRYAALLGVTKVVVETDNEVVYRQITGSYEVKRESLRCMYWIVMGIKEDLQEFAVHLVPRPDNDRVNCLAQKAMITGKFLHFIDAADPMSIFFDGQGAPSEGGMRSVELQIPTQNGYQGSPASTIDSSATYLLQFDGGARMRPGCPLIAGAGVVIYDSAGNEVWCGWRPLEPMTNNAAEYYALLLGLRCARSLGIRYLNVEGDSALIIKHLTGVYTVRDETLRQLFEPTKEAMRDFDEVNLCHIPRKMNKRADFLANWAMDNVSSHGFEET
jgi:ribonuclease HI